MRLRRGGRERPSAALAHTLSGNTGSALSNERRHRVSWNKSNLDFPIRDLARDGLSFDLCRGCLTGVSQGDREEMKLHSTQ